LHCATEVRPLSLGKAGDGPRDRSSRVRSASPKRPSYRLIHDEIISIGGLNANLVHPREVFRPALEYSASAVILAHNHPSGITKPSEADIAITNQIIEAGKILGIGLLDHVIVGKSKYESFPADYN